MRVCSVGSSIRISETACSSSICVTLCTHPLRLDDAGNGDYFVPAHDERPRLSFGAGDLGVDEHVLDLLPAPGEVIAGAPSSYLKARLARGDAPLAPPHLAFERDRRSLEPHLVVLADRRQAPAEVEPLRADGRGQQLVER